MRIDPVLLRAVRGPLVLILLGVLLAIDQAGGPTLGRTWPALIILYGLLRLVESLFSQAGTPGSPVLNQRGGSQ